MKHFHIPRPRSLKSVVVSFLILAIACWLANELPATQPAAISAEFKPVTSSDDHDASTAALNQWLTQLVLAELPHQYTDDRRWGQQQQVYAGFKFRRDQKRLETERVWKMVNHGRWQKYSVSLRDPLRQFSVAIPGVRQTAEGALVVEIDISAALNISARQSQWQRGVQLYSLSGEGWAQIDLHVECELTTQLKRDAQADKKSRHLLSFQPRVLRAELNLREFHLDRISKVGGEVSQQLGRWIEDELRQKISEQSSELTVRLNKQIERNLDKLVVPLDEIWSGDWTTKLATPLPDQWRSWLPAKK